MTTTPAIMARATSGQRAVKAGVRVAIALVWVVNGLWCKVLGHVPRHAAIVARVFDETVGDVVGGVVGGVGGDHVAPLLTVVIGCAELVMAAWVLSGRRPSLCAATQVVVVLTMNVIEQVLAADLLFWGRFNLLWASLFCVVVAVHGRAAASEAEP